MYEFHGWVTVRDSAGDGDDDATRRATELIEAKIVELRIGPGVVDLRWVNGEAQLHLGGFSNRRAAGGDDALVLFAHAGEVAPGSYGIFHAYDDEDRAHANEFRAGVMRRGTVTWITDTNLSPVVPVIEDP